MSFESGSISFRMLYLPDALPANAVERFARHKLASLDYLKDSPISGWVTGRHLLDRHIVKDTAYWGGYLRMTLVQAERKIPNSLLRAECRMEELARQEAEKLATLPVRVRAEIRKAVVERLLPQMPPTLRGLSFVLHDETRLLYVTALSDKQMDAFTVAFVEAQPVKPILLTPESVAAWKRHVDVREWLPAVFSPEEQETEGDFRIGLDFLTWLMFASEARGGIFKLGDWGEFGVVVEGPLMFYKEGAGAHETVLRKGDPVFSIEAKTALLSGKKLRRAKLTLARGDEMWQVTVDARDFVFRGLRLPESEALDPVGRFQDRMRMLDTFTQAFFALYERFLDERRDEKQWQKTIGDVRSWLADRSARR
jgi:hypothetical protein